MHMLVGCLQRTAGSLDPNVYTMYDFATLCRPVANANKRVNVKGKSGDQVRPVGDDRWFDQGKEVLQKSLILGRHHEL